MGWDISSLWHLLLFFCRFALEVLEDLLLSNGLTSALFNSKCALRERYYDGISFRIPGIPTLRWDKLHWKVIDIAFTNGIHIKVRGLVIGLTKVVNESENNIITPTTTENVSQTNPSTTPSPAVNNVKPAQFLLSWLKHFHIEFDSIRVLVDGSNSTDSEDNIMLAVDCDSLVFTRKITANNCESNLLLSRMLLRFNPSYSKTHTILDLCALSVNSNTSIVRDQVESRISQTSVCIDRLVYNINLDPKVHVDWMWLLQSLVPPRGKNARDNRVQPPVTSYVNTTKTSLTIKSTVISPVIAAGYDVVLDELQVVSEVEVNNVQLLDIHDVLANKCQKLSLSLRGVGNDQDMCRGGETPLITFTITKEMSQLNGIDMDLFVTCNSVVQPLAVTLPVQTVTSLLHYWGDVASLLPARIPSRSSDPVKPHCYSIDVMCEHVQVNMVTSEYCNTVALSSFTVSTAMDNGHVIVGGLERVWLAVGKVGGQMSNIAVVTSCSAIIELEKSTDYYSLPTLEDETSLSEWRKWCEVLPDSSYTKNSINIGRVDVAVTTDSCIAVGLLSEVVSTATNKLPKGITCSSEMLRVSSLRPRGNTMLDLVISNINAQLEYSSNVGGVEQGKKVSCVLKRGIRHWSKSVGQVPFIRQSKLQVYEDISVLYNHQDTHTTLLNVSIESNNSNEQLVLEGVQTPLYIVRDSHELPHLIILQSEKTIVNISSLRVILANQDFSALYSAIDTQSKVRDALRLPLVTTLTQYNKELTRLLTSNNRLVEYAHYKHPTSTTKICMESITIDCYFNTNYVYNIQSSKTNIYRIQHGSALSQVCGSTSSLSITDYSLDVLHKKFIQNIANLVPNEVVFHMSSKKGAQPLIEVRLDRLCLIYKQRSLMTMICYFRDHLLPSMLNYRLPSELFSPVNTTVSSSLLPVEWQQHTVIPPYGMSRVNLLFNMIEAHLPVSSNGNDGLVIIATSLLVTKTSPEYRDSYTNGPLLSRRQSINYLDVITKVSSLETVRNALVTELTLLPLATPTPPVGCAVNMYKITLQDTTICSWCNNNAIGENMTLHVTFSIKPVAPEFDGVYSSVFKSLQYQLHRWKNRNISDVTVEVSHIQWKLAQGQYTCIVRMIQQNFPELTVQIPDPFVTPNPKIIQLKENIYGKNAIDQRVPMVSDVRILIQTGSIMALKNNSEYYDLITRLLRVADASDEVGDIMEEEKGISSENTVPTWSYHQVYTRKIHQKMKRESSQQGIDDSNGNNSSSSSNRPLNAIITIFFENLFLRFYRMHFGGGNGIDVSTRTMIITKCLGLNEYDVEVIFNDTGTTGGVDLSHIVTEKIIFGPKWCFNPEKNSQNRSGIGSNTVDNEENYDGIGKGTGDNHDAHIRYTQHGVGNLRRCIIDIVDSYAVAHIEDIVVAVKYFVDPITLTALRNFERLARVNLGNLDYKAALDLEIHTKNVVITLPNTVSHEGSSAALCIHADIDFTQAWRGFMRVGPGKRTAEIVANIYSIYISPMHDIQPYGVHSLVDPFCFSHTLESLIIPEDHVTLHTNLGLLAPWVELSPIWKSKISCCGEIMAANLISIEIYPLKYENPPVPDPMGVEIPEEIKFNLSLKDAQFISTAITQLKATATSIKAVPVVDQYPAMMRCLSDISHLPLLTYYLVSTDNKKPIIPWMVRDLDVICDICNLKILLRNNTYNLKIIKANLDSTRISYNKTDGKLHVAAGTNYSVWAHNDLGDEWEPLIENTSFSAVAATDATKSSLTTSTADDVVAEKTVEKSLIRIEFFCNPVEINLSQHTLADVIRKFNLSDVVTTSSSELPPYRVINDLGVDIQCAVTVGNYENTLDCIGINGQVPIESSMLSQPVNGGDQRRYERNSSFHTHGENEHFLGFKMIFQGKLFASKSPLAIGREGLFPYEMNIAGKNKLNSESEGLLLKRVTPTDLSTSSNNSECKDTPYTFINIRIKADGSRELTLRSMLSIKNNTKRLMQIQVVYKHEKYEKSLEPQVEINIPVYVVHSKAALFIRFDDKSEWIEALATFSTLVSNGFWEAPSKLRAEMIPCPPETTDIVNTSWILLMKPEVKDARSGNKSFLSVRYPSSENNKSNLVGVDVYGDGGVALDDNLYNLSKNYLKSIKIVAPVCLQLLPPLQLCNVVCQPLLYRLADKEGLVVGEGVLVPGELVDINSLRDLFKTQFYLSLRMVNYCWSKWVKLLSKHNPYAPNEKTVEIVMNSMDLMLDSDAVDALHLPSLVLNISLREHLVRISCPVFISNRSGIPLDIADYAVKEQFIPQVVGTSLSTIMLNKTPVKSLGGGSSSNLAMNSVSEAFPDSNSDDSDSDSNSSQRDSFDNHHIPNPATTTNPSGLKFKNIVRTLIVHFPNDHLRKLEVAAADSWTLLDVFNSVASKLSVNRYHQTEANYLFFYFDEIKNCSKRIIPSPFDEQDAFVTRNILGSNSSNSNNSSSSPGSIGISEGVEKEKTSMKSLFTTSTKASNTSSTVSNDVLPHHMALSMIVNCNLSPVPMSTVVGALTSTRIRLCHISEWNIYKQIHSVKLIVEKKDNSFTNIFSKNKITYRCNFMDFNGYIPFHPINSRKILGFAPTMCLRVVDGATNYTSSSIHTGTTQKSEWSEGVDLFKSDFSNENITLNHNKLVDSNCQKAYQFGIFIEKGKNFYQNITAISIVPRYLILSHLIKPLQIRQINVESTAEIMFLPPNTMMSFHFSSYLHPKLLQLRWDEGISEKWCGEVDIGKVGLFYAKLRDPMVILKIQVEVVGSSLVATISEQDLTWPPYRICNNSSFELKYQQVDSRSQDPAVARAATQLLVSSDQGDSMKNYYQQQLLQQRQYEQSKLQQEYHVPVEMDTIPAGVVTPYVWDYPISQQHIVVAMLTLPENYSLRNNKKDSICICLDDDKSEVVVKLYRSPPPIRSPQAEGMLMRKVLNSNNKTEESWNTLYCILKDTLIYCFEDSSCKKMIDIVNLSRPHQAGTQLAKLKKYGKNIPNNIDANYYRIYLLQLTDQMGLFKKFQLDGVDNLVEENSPPVPGEFYGVSNELGLLLSRNISVDQLLEYISTVKFHIFQLIAAILACHQADDDISARKVLNDLYKLGFLTLASDDVVNSSSSRLQQQSSSRNLSKPSLMKRVSTILGSNEGVETSVEQEDFFTFPNNTEVFLSYPSLMTGLDDAITSSTSSEVSSNIFYVGFDEFSFFKCSSNEEMTGWMFGCRLSIETDWIHAAIGRSASSQYTSIHSFTTEVRFRVLADGPTKVLDITERKLGEVGSELTSLSPSKLNPSDASMSASETSFLSFSASVIITSASLSIIDAEPTEVLYLSVKDIGISIERELDYLRFECVFQDIQVSNQLLRPAFPVMLSTIRNQDISKKKGMILHQLDEESTPAFQIGFVQRHRKSYYQDSSHVRSSSLKQHKDLLYYDMVSVYLAPMQLDLDEEAFVRLYRYVNTIISNTKRSSEGMYMNNEEESLAALHNGTKSWGIMDPSYIINGYLHMLDSTTQPYIDYNPYIIQTRSLFCKEFVINPLDVLVTMKPSPEFPVTTIELGVVSVLGQLINARLLLGDMYRENFDGTIALLKEAIIQHYKTQGTRQLQKLITGSELGELTDLFNEAPRTDTPSATSDSNSIWTLAKGGKSLATRTIGGTTAFTSKVTGGTGRLMSALTMDSNFYRQRASRRMNKATSVSEGLYVGTKELAKNTFEGVSGIVISPYRGWEAGGSVGFGVGIAKGLLGVALKPAVGVFDLAARATEGMRSNVIDERQGNRADVSRSRIPRAFGTNGVLRAYSRYDAAAQYLLDKLLVSTSQDYRPLVLHHHYCNRTICEPHHSGNILSNNFIGNASALSPFHKHDEGYKDLVNLQEAWGFPASKGYITLVTSDKVYLAQITSSGADMEGDIRLIWSCPTSHIDQCFCDARGDLIISVRSPVHAACVIDKECTVATIHDTHFQDYYTMQLILEQTLGGKIARIQPLYPYGGMTATGVLKKYATGVKSMLLSPTKHNIQLVGYIIYEYTVEKTKSGEPASPAVKEGYEKDRSSPNIITNDKLEWDLGEIFKQQLEDFEDNNDEQKVVAAGFKYKQQEKIDLVVTGPFAEDNGQASLTLTRKDGNNMRVIKRDEDSGRLIDHYKPNLSLIFESNIVATQWRHAIEAHMAIRPSDILTNKYDFDTRSNSSTISSAIRSINKISGRFSLLDRNDDDFINDRFMQNTVTNIIVIPCGSDEHLKSVEQLKIEIAKVVQR